MGYKLKRILIYPDGVTEKQVYPALPIPSSGLLGYRPLQSDLKDLSGNGKDGSWFSGTGSFETANGKIGAKCTRTSDSYEYTTQSIVTTLDYQNMPITMFGWVCFSSINTNGWGGVMSSSYSGGNGYTMGTRPGDNKYPNATFQGTTLRIASSVPSTNTWYFWCATFEGTTMKTYFNGTLANTSTSATYGTAGGVWKLGCAMVDGTQPYNKGINGWVRHCGIYNRAISDAEVSAIYTATA